MKPRVLILIDWFYPGFRSGGPATSCLNLVTQLSHEFDFCVVTRDTDYCETRPYPGIQYGQWNQTEPGVKVRYLNAQEVKQGVPASIAGSDEFEIVYINGLYSFRFSIQPLLKLKKSRRKVIVAPRGMLSPGSIGVKPIRKKLFLMFARLTGLYRGVQFHATSEAEASAVLQHTGNHPVTVVPNLSAKASSLPVAEKKPDELKLVTIARYAPEKNIHLALEALSKCSAPVHARFYGPVYDQTYFNKCKALLSGMPANVQVELLPEVPPALIGQTLSWCHFFFLPSSGENFGHVITEALMRGRPVIISDRTPWRNLRQQNAGFDVPLDLRLMTSVIDSCAALGQDDYLCFARGASAYWKQQDPAVKSIPVYKSLFTS